MGASWRRKAAVTAGVAVLGLVVLAGAGAGWHVSLGFDGGPGVEKNASTASTYVLTFDEGGAGWNFDEVRIFFEGDVGLSDASRQSVTFLENGAEVPVAGVTGGQLTQQEQDDTVTAWDRALRVELGEEMDGGGSYQVEIDGAVTPSSPGQYNLTLNTYISGDRQTNRDGPDRSVNNKTATYRVVPDGGGDSDLLLILLLVLAGAGAYYYYRRQSRIRQQRQYPRGSRQPDRQSGQSRGGRAPHRQRGPENQTQQGPKQGGRSTREQESGGRRPGDGGRRGDRPG